jgi:hypothetical protein
LHDSRIYRCWIAWLVESSKSGSETRPELATHAAWTEDDDLSLVGIVRKIDPNAYPPTGEADRLHFASLTAHDDPATASLRGLETT